MCNFSLLGERVTNRLPTSVPRLLVRGGALVVQTLHPWVTCADEACLDGWRHGSWLGIDVEFGVTAPCYSRTMQSWMQLFADSDLRVETMMEPIKPQTGRPASLN